MFLILDIKCPFACGETDLYLSIEKFQNILTRIVDKVKSVVVFLTDFSRTFDSLSYDIPIGKLNGHGFDESSLQIMR